MTLHEFPALIQGTDEWHDQRRGIVTASVVGQLVGVRPPGPFDFTCPSCDAPASSQCISKVKRNGVEGALLKNAHPERISFAARNADQVEGKIEPLANDYSRSLTAILVAERINGWTDPQYINDDMMRGTMDEPRARDKYGERYAPVTETGFMVRDDWGFQIGFSPDGLVGDEGLIEAKSRRPKKHLQTILANEVPAANMAQIQCGLLVSGRDWCDYLSFCGGMPLYVKRVLPDKRWHDAIIAAVTTFEETAAVMTALYQDATKGLAQTERTYYEEMSL